MSRYRFAAPPAFPQLQIRPWWLQMVIQLTVWSMIFCFWFLLILGQAVWFAGRTLVDLIRRRRRPAADPPPTDPPPNTSQASHSNRR